jgi:hypothetical protein
MVANFIFRILVDYRLRHLLNNFDNIHLSYTCLHSNGDNYIMFENFTASIVDLMVANIRLLASLTRRRLY